MDMTRDFITKIQESAAPNQIGYRGRLFVDKDMDALPYGPVAHEPMRTESLSSIVDYIKHETDKGP